MFSIITPTYNREKLLHRVFESLQSQTFKKFEWIIIDDASKDNTEGLVQQWKAESPEMDITYYNQGANQGKSHAVNRGISLCKYNYSIIADSDDTFAGSTLSDLKQIWEQAEKNPNYETIAAIWTLVSDEKGSIIGDSFPEDFWQVDFKSRVLNQTIFGEKWHCWKTSVLKEFPMFASKECAIEESTNWNRINKHYEFICINKSHRTYFNTADGLIAKPKSRRERAKSNYFSSYYALKDASLQELVKYKYYRDYSFNFIKSCFRYNNKNLKLSFIQHLMATANFIIILPKRVLDKLL